MCSRSRNHAGHSHLKKVRIGEKEGREIHAALYIGDAVQAVALRRSVRVCHVLFQVPSQPYLVVLIGETVFNVQNLTAR